MLLHQIAKARIADLHQQAERDHMARPARLDRNPRDRHLVPGDLATGLARRVLAVLATRSPRPPVSAPGQAPKATS